MADKFMRIGGSDGTVARGLKTDSEGKIKTSPGSSKSLRVTKVVEHPGTGVHTVPLGIVTEAPFIEVVLRVGQSNRGVRATVGFATYPPANGTNQAVLTHGGQINIYLNENNLNRAISATIPVVGNQLNSLRLYSLDDLPVTIDVWIYEVDEFPQQKGSYQSLRYETLGDERILYFDFSELTYVTNDSDDYIEIAFNYSTQPEWIRLNAGETLSNIKMSMQRAKLRGAKSGQPIRIMGVR